MLTMFGSLPVTLSLSFEELMGAAFAVIAIIGWLVNLVSQNQPKGRPGNRGPGQPLPQPQRRQQVQNEIEQFLKQARGVQQRAKQEDLVPPDQVQTVEPGRATGPRRPAPPKRGRRTKRDVWEDQTGRRVPAAPPARTLQAKPAPPVEQPTARRPGDGLAKRHIQPTVTEQELVRHLQTTLGPRVAAAVEKDLPHLVNQSVSSHLGTFAAAEATSTGEAAMADTLTKRASPASKILMLMRSRQGVRDAILLNELLSKPKALRSGN
jgi:hypothetical protein